jgi:calcium-dependent protein kinase
LCHDSQGSHLAGHVSCELRPENFLFATPDPDAPIKISDFGLSCYIENQDSVITDACGSAYYIAPEIFTRKYTKSADIWAVGVILYLLLSGEMKYDACYLYTLR